MKHTREYVVNGSQVMSDLEQAFAAQSGQIGVHLGHSPWILIDQARIDAFAEITEDQQFIHVDPARARAGPEGPHAHVQFRRETAGALRRRRRRVRTCVPRGPGREAHRRHQLPHRDAKGAVGSKRARIFAFSAPL